ncbi:FAD-dependent oxidoreductase [candidate division KSB1 bacterium]
MKKEDESKFLSYNIKNYSLKGNTISRRQALIAMGAASGGVLIPDIEIKEKSGGNIETINTEVDVLVVGGGTAGTIAAIQSARAGARTAVLERGSQLGGTMTTAGVDFPGLFYAWGRQVIGGIGWELVKKTVELNDDKMPDFSIPFGHNHPRHHVKINAHLYTLLTEEACLEAGVDLLYYEQPTAVKYTGNCWNIDVIGKGIRRKVTCKQLIDCTGGADVVGMTGLPRIRGEVTQPGTLMFKFGGYDSGKLDTELIEKRYKEAMQDGLLKEGDYAHTGIGFMHFLRSGGRNSQHIFNADSSTSVTQKTTNINGRKSVLRLLRFLRTLPCCENTRIVKLAPETGVRESYRIAGETLITGDDYVSGRVFEDAVCYSYYPIDVHDKDGVEPKHLKEGIVATIPFGALIPKNSRNLLIAGRSISSDRIANSALRVQASCMAMGQAAGAASALAVKLNVTPGKVPLNKLRKLLKDHGAVTPL